MPFVDDGGGDDSGGTFTDCVIQLVQLGAFAFVIFPNGGGPSPEADARGCWVQLNTLITT